MPQRIHPKPRITPNWRPTMATFSVCPEKLSIGRNSAPAMETASDWLRAQPIPTSQLYVGRVSGLRLSESSVPELRKTPAFFASEENPLDGGVGVMRMTSDVCARYHVALKSAFSPRKPMSKPPSSSFVRSGLSDV